MLFFENINFSLEINETKENFLIFTGDCKILLKNLVFTGFFVNKKNEGKAIIYSKVTNFTVFAFRIKIYEILIQNGKMLFVENLFFLKDVLFFKNQFIDCFLGILAFNSTTTYTKGLILKENYFQNSVFCEIYRGNFKLENMIALQNIVEINCSICKLFEVFYVQQILMRNLFYKGNSISFKDFETTFYIESEKYILLKF